MVWIKVIYWISIVLLWALIVMNFRNLLRNHRLSKEYKLLIDDVKEKIDQLEIMQNKYIELLSEQWEEVSDEMDGVLPQHQQ